MKDRRGEKLFKEFSPTSSKRISDIGENLSETRLHDE